MAYLVEIPPVPTGYTFELATATDELGNTGYDLTLNGPSSYTDTEFILSEQDVFATAEMLLDRLDLDTFHDSVVAADIVFVEVEDLSEDE